MSNSVYQFVSSAYHFAVEGVIASDLTAPLLTCDSHEGRGRISSRFCLRGSVKFTEEEVKAQKSVRAVFLYRLHQSKTSKTIC